MLEVLYWFQSVFSVAKIKCITLKNVLTMLKPFGERFTIGFKVSFRKIQHLSTQKRLTNMVRLQVILRIGFDLKKIGERQWDIYVHVGSRNSRQLACASRFSHDINCFFVNSLRHATRIYTVGNKKVRSYFSWSR